MMTKGKWAAFGLAALLIQAGCMGAIPVQTEKPDEPFLHSSLNRLLGSNRVEVLKELGQPNYILAKEDKRYFVYKGYSRGRMVIVGLMIPIPDEEVTYLNCSFLEFGSDGALRRFETKSQGDWTPHRTVNCKKLLWSPEELAGFKDITFGRDPKELGQYPKELGQHTWP